MLAREAHDANTGELRAFSRTSKPGLSAARLPSHDETKIGHRSESWWKSLDPLFLSQSISKSRTCTEPVNVLTDMGIVAEF